MTERWATIETAPKRLVMWGASDQCKVNYPILKSLGCTVEALIDDTPGLLSPFADVPLHTGTQGLDFFLKTRGAGGLGFVIAIGNPFGYVRMKLHHMMMQHGLVPVSFADATSLVCRSATCGPGLQVMPMALVHNDAKIGSQCIINTKALIEHDCVLENGVEIGPGAVLCGRVHVGENTWIGANATIRPRITIGDNTIIGAGAVVVTDIPSNVVAVGVPARVMHENRGNINI